jgi:hypothetical protein
MVQSIIVYNSLAEAMLWESGMMFPLLVSLCVLFATVVVVNLMA